MDESQSLSHSKWECKYHVVFIPKCRRRTLYKQLRQHLGEVFRNLAQQKGSRIEEGHLMPDHVHMLISIPPKYAVSQVIGYITAGPGLGTDHRQMRYTTERTIDGCPGPDQHREPPRAPSAPPTVNID